MRCGRVRGWGVTAGAGVVGEPQQFGQPGKRRAFALAGGWLAGGRDVFAELREHRSARDRVVDPAEVARRDPQLILVSWCGKPADLDVVRGRPGWDRISAVREGRVHEVDAATLLSPGPALLSGLRTIHELVQQAKLARLLRTTGKPFVIAVNKVDAPSQEANAAVFHRIGVPIFPIAAEHGTALGHDLLDVAVADLGPDGDAAVLADDLGDGAGADEVVEDGRARELVEHHLAKRIRCAEPPGAFFGVYHPDTFWFEDGAATAERATPTASAPDLLWLEGGSAAPVD